MASSWSIGNSYVADQRTAGSAVVNDSVITERVARPQTAHKESIETWHVERVVFR